jgi:SAM-dependent methyltransferase
MSEQSSETTVDPETQRRAVRERYGAIANQQSTGCCEPAADCDTDTDSTAADTASKLGYQAEDLDAVDGEANLGLGCGNPTAIAALNAGETVLDLGSGAGFDCFLAAQEVGEEGQVIGVDMAPEMIDKARENAAQNETDAVEFRLGEIEHLPVADETVDTIISNCVINLSPAKQQVFDEAFRVLRSGGRLAVSDIVLSADPPAGARNDLDTITACAGDAATVEELETMLAGAGFVDIEIEPKDESREFIREWSDEYAIEEFAVSATIDATKPASRP